MPSTDRPGVRLTRWGHSCVLLTVDQPNGDPRHLLLDPGNLTPPLTAEVGPVDAVLVTHAHADHVDPEQIRRLQQAAATPVYGDEGVRALLADVGLENTRMVTSTTSSIADVPVVVWTSPHEVIYPGVPLPANLSYLIADTVLAPGDAFFVPDVDVDVLLLPIGAPWMKLADTIDYLRAVAPRVAVPVHDNGLAHAHQNLHRSLLTKFAPSGTTVASPGLGELLDLATLEVTT
ncbi:MAG: MBL fold metallo-hydrolase [Nakamurella sp.]